MNRLDLDTVLEHSGEEFINAYRELLNKENINTTGNLSNSLSVTTQEQSDNWSVWLSIADYYEYIENGRLPGKQPPIALIENWIKNKHLPLERNLSWAIAKSIAKKGIPGKHILERSLDIIEPNLDKEIDIQTNKLIDSIWI